jgi:hypothetical protein
MCSFTNNLLTPLYSEESISQELVLQAMNLGLSHYKGEEEERRRKEKTEAGKAEAVPFQANPSQLFSIPDVSGPKASPRY